MRIREFVDIYGFPRSFVDQIVHGRYAKEFTIRSGTAPNSAILELMRAAESSAYIESIRVAANMCISLLNEAAADVKNIENEWREKRDKR